MYDLNVDSKIVYMLLVWLDTVFGLLAYDALISAGKS